MLQDIQLDLYKQCIKWFRSYLSNRYQSDCIWDKQLPNSRLSHGIPQGPALVLLLFITYVAYATIILEKRELCSHIYADDVQLYLPCHHGHITTCAGPVSAYTENITTWVASNGDPAKTNSLCCSTTQPLLDITLSPVVNIVPLPASICNLDVLFKPDLSLTTHVNQLTAHCYSCLWCIKSCRRALTSATLVKTLIVLRLHYCNSLLIGCNKLSSSTNFNTYLTTQLMWLSDGCNKQLVDKLQCILNCAAHGIFGGDPQDHVTPLLCNQLHWLQVTEQLHLNYVY